MAMSKIAYWWNNANVIFKMSVVARALGESKIHELPNEYWNKKWSELNKADKRHIEIMWNKDRIEDAIDRYRARHSD